ncbi:DUF1800 domain-containing protein [Sphaerotilus sp.]|uniref:DUF1800 domain-containing protein n=1 Tax=Sphaerotilus sp. TaxID=2093942 RepID=UPI0025D0DC85|nr:DUF1800 domain-containing protein [Sphaerotilus sp.]
MSQRRAFLTTASGGALWLAGCTSVRRLPTRRAVRQAIDPADLAVLDRLTWGASAASADDWAERGRRDAVQALLHPAADAALPVPVQGAIEALSITRLPLPTLVAELEQLRRGDDRQPYQQRLALVAREAAVRSLLQALHSPHGLREQMVWFWFNHFNVGQTKANLRMLVGDYEQALRPHALGRFRDLLVASATHAAMLRYLDNEQNAAGRINENHARELLELHTLGVDGGYSQRDVQELARVLTGLGVNFSDTPAKVAPKLQPLYRREGLTEFHPGRHDMGDKTVLGQMRKGGRGWDEILEQLGALARYPATARHVCRKLAVFLVADEPPAALVDRLSQRFLATDGDIALTLEALVAAPEFTASLGRKFKDPVHYVLSALRLVADPQAPLVDMAPVMTALNRLGQSLYGRATPDGYPLDESAWNGSGQMAARFEVARTLSRLSATPGRPAVAPDERLIRPLGERTRAVLAQATLPQDRHALLLSSPEFMLR